MRRQPSACMCLRVWSMVRPCSAANVLGDSVAMEAAASETLFAVDPVLMETDSLL